MSTLAASWPSWSWPHVSTSVAGLADRSGTSTLRSDAGKHLRQPRCAGHYFKLRTLATRTRLSSHLAMDGWRWRGAQTIATHRR